MNQIEFATDTCLLKHLVLPFRDLTIVKYQMLNYKSKAVSSLELKAKLNHRQVRPCSSYEVWQHHYQYVY